MNPWWLDNGAEHYWLEATDRTDIGANLRAPENDASGRDNWRYTLFKYAHIDDVVFHYDKRGTNPGITAWSHVAGDASPAPIVWAARGTYSRAKKTKPTRQPGYVIPLAHHRPLFKPLTMDHIRERREELSELVTELRARYGAPLYFPFELSPKRPIRLLQGYAFKLPRKFVELLLAPGPDDVLTNDFGFWEGETRLHDRPSGMYTEATHVVIQNLLSLERRYRNATPREKLSISKRIERGPVGQWAKRINGHRCQICQALNKSPFSFLKPDGQWYVEAHHVESVSMKERGVLAFANVITVCANHHRELHFGGVKFEDLGERFRFQLESGRTDVSKVRLRNLIKQ